MAIAGSVVNRRSVHLKHKVPNEKESASNPLLHIHADRWQTLPNYKNHETYIEIITFYAASLDEL